MNQTAEVRRIVRTVDNQIKVLGVLLPKEKIPHRKQAIAEGVVRLQLAISTLIRAAG